MRDPQIVYHRKIINDLKGLLEKLNIKSALRPDRTWITGNKVKLMLNGKEVTYISDASYTVNTEGLNPYDLDDGSNS